MAMKNNGYIVPTATKLLMEAANASGKTSDALAREAGIAQNTLWMFMSGRRVLRLDNTEKL
jgi:hypothetical protein